MYSARLGAVAVAATALLPSACGDEPVDPESIPIENHIVVRTVHTDETITFRPVVNIHCGDWLPGETPVRALHILVGVETEPQDEDELPPLWRLTAAVDDVRIGEAIPFPADWDWTEGYPPAAQVGVYHPPVDYYTTEPDSDGSITFESLDCRIGGVVEFSIDAVIGAELYLDAAVHMSGTFRGPVGEAPAGF